MSWKRSAHVIDMIEMIPPAQEN
eukprot:SAG11_NODE_16398_length_548_cov_1.040089_1_plen_22_part_10